MKTENIVLDNGLNTLFIDAPHSNVTTAQIWFKAGSSLEHKDNLGIAHFLEHMFFKGTQKYPDMMIAKTVESYGGEINAFTSFDYTCYYINGPSTDSTTTVDVLMDMVSNPEFRPEDIEPEKGVVFEEYRRSIDGPSQYNFFEIQKNCFPKAYHKPILGTEKTIQAFNRLQLLEFRNKYYNLENSLLVVAGNLSKKTKIIETINQYKLPSGLKSSFPKFKLKSHPSAKIHENNVNQSTLTITIQAPDYRDSQSPVEDLAINCLAFGDISPLYSHLVTKSSLASSTSGSTMFFTDGGCHFIRLSFPSENTKNVLSELPKVFEYVFKTLFSQDDIDRIRNQYIASKIYEKESIESFAFALGHGFAQCGNIHCEEEFIDKMKKCSKEKIHRKLIEIFTRATHFTLQVPKNNQSTKTKALLVQAQEKIRNLSKKHLTETTQIPLLTSQYDSEAKVIEITKGIKLFYRQNELTPTFALQAFIKGGLSHETQEENGIYNLLARNLAYGHSQVKYHTLKSELEKKSSYINGFSGRNAYGMTLHGLSDFSEDLIHHFMMLLFKPSFPNQHFKVEKELVKRSLHIQKEDPVKKCFSEFNKLVFNKHAYANDIIGNEKSVRGITRKKVNDCHINNLQSQEIVLSYCGDQDLEVILEKIKSYLDLLPQRKVARAKKKNLLRPLVSKNLHFSFDREQTHILIGKPSFKAGTIEDLYLKVFTTFLSGQSSELFLEVRDRQGLCYAVQALQNSALEASYWGIYIGSGTDKKDQAIKVIRSILEKYQKKGLSRSEFKMTLKMIQGQNLVNVQTNEDYANFYSIAILHNLGIDYQHQSFEKIKAMAHKDFNNFLGNFLKDDWNIVTVGR